jgi:antitoxin VapB
MSLNIKNPEAYRLVKALADATGESMTQAVTVAVRERLDRLQADARRDDDFDVEEVLAMAREIGSRFPPGYLEQAIDDLYDERGLPR